MAIVIKKRVTLGFLGKDYKEAYLDFQSIPVIDFEDIQAKLKKFEKNEAGSVSFILKLLKQYFIGGQFPDGDVLKEVTAEDLDGLDALTCVECFKLFTGQELDPKVETPSTN